MAISESIIHAQIVDPFSALDAAGCHNEKPRAVMEAAMDEAEDIACNDGMNESQLRDTGQRLMGLIGAMLIVLEVSDHRLHEAENAFFAAGVHRMSLPGRA